MATNNGTHGVQNDAYAHSLNNSNTNIPIATRGGSDRRHTLKRSSPGPL